MQQEGANISLTDVMNSCDESISGKAIPYLHVAYVQLPIRSRQRQPVEQIHREQDFIIEQDLDKM